MAYTYHVEFTIQNGASELRIGSALEKVIGFLRTMLPNEPGFIQARGMRSIDIEGSTHVVIQSTWDLWEDLQRHRDSGLAEREVLCEFGQGIDPDALTVHMYDEVA